MAPLVIPLLHRGGVSGDDSVYGALLSAAESHSHSVQDSQSIDQLLEVTQGEAKGCAVFLRVVHADGDWGTMDLADELSRERACVQQLRQELRQLEGLLHGDMLLMPGRGWRQGRQETWQSSSGTTLHLETTYVAEEDGVLHPGVKVSMISSPCTPERLPAQASGNLALLPSSPSQPQQQAAAIVPVGTLLAGSSRDEQPWIDMGVTMIEWQRMAAITSNILMYMTLLDLDQGVVMQNSLSKRFWGDRIADGTSSLQLLEELLGDEEEVAELLQCMEGGFLWKKTLQLPFSVRHDQASSQDIHSSQTVGSYESLGSPELVQLNLNSTNDSGDNSTGVARPRPRPRSGASAITLGQGLDQLQVIPPSWLVAEVAMSNDNRGSSPSNRFTVDSARFGSCSQASADIMTAEHEVEVMTVLDPVTKRRMLLLLQTDVTVRAKMEKSMAAASEMQLLMLGEMFPRHVLEYVAQATKNREVCPWERIPGVSKLAKKHDGVTILFMDIVGFTSMSKLVDPVQIMAYLNSLFTIFDDLVDQYNVYKVETAGDCYIVAGGLMHTNENGFLSVSGAPVSDTEAAKAQAREGAHCVMSFAKTILRCASLVKMPHNSEPTQVRIGIHTGNIVSGLIGTKLPKFGLYGDTMNTASRMESTSRPGCIQCSCTTYKLIEGGAHTFDYTGGVEVKGKGMMDTYLWIPEKHPDEHYESVQEHAQEVSALISHLTTQNASVLQKVLNDLELGAPPHDSADSNAAASKAAPWTAPF